MKRMTNEETIAFLKEHERFGDYNGIDEYIDDIVTILVNSSWHYDEQIARELVQDRMDYIREAYEDKVPVGFSSAEVGYCCG